MLGGGPTQGPPGAGDHQVRGPPGARGYESASTRASTGRGWEQRRLWRPPGVSTGRAAPRPTNPTRGYRKTLTRTVVCQGTELGAGPALVAVQIMHIGFVVALRLTALGQASPWLLHLMAVTESGNVAGHGSRVGTGGGDRRSAQPAGDAMLAPTSLRRLLTGAPSSPGSPPAAGAVQPCREHEQRVSAADTNHIHEDEHRDGEHQDQRREDHQAVQEEGGHRDSRHPGDKAVASHKEEGNPGDDKDEAERTHLRAYFRVAKLATLSRKSVGT